MTEKERIIRKAANDRADFLEKQNRLTWADDIRQALADTEDTGGEKCEWTVFHDGAFIQGCNDEIYQKDNEYSRPSICPGCEKPIQEGKRRQSPPKEQDDEAMDKAFEEALILCPDATPIMHEIAARGFYKGWDAARKWMGVTNADPRT